MRQSRPTYFVTAVTHQRMRLFQVHEKAQIAMDTMHRYAAEGRYALHAAVVMPDHVHVLITPAEDQLLERCVQCIKGGISFALPKPKYREVWQSGNNNHRVRDGEEFLAFVEYIRRNPAKRGLMEWPFVYVGDEASRG